MWVICMSSETIKMLEFYYSINIKILELLGPRKKWTMDGNFGGILFVFYDCAITSDGAAAMEVNCL